MNLIGGLLGHRKMTIKQYPDKTMRLFALTACMDYYQTESVGEVLPRNTC